MILSFTKLCTSCGEILNSKGQLKDEEEEEDIFKQLQLPKESWIVLVIKMNEDNILDLLEGERYFAEKKNLG